MVLTKFIILNENHIHSSDSYESNRVYLICGYNISSDRIGNLLVLKKVLPIVI